MSEGVEQSDPRPEAADQDGRDSIDRYKNEIFIGLDRLAFALEMEAADALEEGDEETAERLEDQRLGVRLAQRHVAGVYADEVDPRIERTREDYDRRTGGPGPV